MLVWNYLWLMGVPGEMSVGAQSSFQRAGVHITETTAIIGTLVGSLREPRSSWTLEAELLSQRRDLAHKAGKASTATAWTTPTFGIEDFRQQDSDPSHQHKVHT